ncbi:MAG: Shikimate kinase [Clostridia bacterium]|jgi:shikimate kinase|nr:Shikimate kinase [Clostridia bacterium]
MNIVLLGFMGSGKTTIGKAFAQRKNLKFIDTDDVIEKQNNQLIKDIFSSYGEAHFRLLEKQAIDQLVGLDNCVIAIGGGAVMYHDNLDTLKRVGTTVFLDAPLQKIIMNLKGKFRPLVGHTIDEDKMRELLEYRYPTYRKADLIIHTDNLDIQQIVDEIIAKLGL